MSTGLGHLKDEEEEPSTSTTLLPGIGRRPQSSPAEAGTIPLDMSNCC